TEFVSKGTEVVTVEEPSKKAAAEGAVLWYTKQIVSARVARFTIGAEMSVMFNPADAEHLKRRNGAFVPANGLTYLPNGFEVIVGKGHLIPQNFSRLSNFNYAYSEKPETMNNFRQDLLVWEGEETPRWIADADGKRLPQIRSICSIEADLTPALAGLKQVKSEHGVEYWHGEWNVRCIYGGTKLQARLEWEVQGKTYQGPIKVVPTSVLK
ncbi:hypothetical protein FRC14_005758, partial [Serendipita sp. 396]